MCARTTNPVARLAARVYHAQLIAEVKKATGNDKIEFLPLDLDSLASARQCAELFLARALPLHLLIANAGIGATGLTVDGFERQFQVNYLGHFLLVVLLLDVLKSSAPSRIVLVSSSAYNLAREVSATEVRELPRAGSASSTFRRYCSAKLAMIWFMQELTARLEHTGVLVHAVNPGPVSTDFAQTGGFNGFVKFVATHFMRSVKVGVNHVIYPGYLPKYGTATGLYIDKLRVTKLNKTARDLARAHALWAQSIAWVGLAQAAPADGDHAERRSL